MKKLLITVTMLVDDDVSEEEIKKTIEESTEYLCSSLGELKVENVQDT